MEVIMMAKTKYKVIELEGYKMSVSDFLLLEDRIPYDRIVLEKGEEREDVTVEELDGYQNEMGKFYVDKSTQKLWYLVRVRNLEQENYRGGVKENQIGRL